eukprot:Sspe_Gene.92083::Locus_63835_Transcript_8_9_Confidence_0.353_Length_572::g.92083::m.92083
MSIHLFVSQLVPQRQLGVLVYGTGGEGEEEEEEEHATRYGRAEGKNSNTCLSGWRSWGRGVCVGGLPFFDGPHPFSGKTRADDEVGKQKKGNKGRGGGGGGGGGVRLKKERGVLGTRCIQRSRGGLWEGGGWGGGGGGEG